MKNLASSLLCDTKMPKSNLDRHTFAHSLILSQVYRLKFVQRAKPPTEQVEASTPICHPISAIKLQDMM